VRLSLRWLDQKGGVYLGLWTATTIGLSVFVTLAGKDLPGGVVAAYGVAVTGFTAHGISKVVKGTKNDESRPNTATSEPFNPFGLSSPDQGVPEAERPDGNN
jgi:hypothetical protein